MFSFAPDLATFLNDNVDKYIEALGAAVNRVNPGAYAREDFRQSIMGFMSILIEAVNEEGSEKRSFFLETIIPTLVQNGEDMRGVIYPSTTVGMIVAVDILQNFKTEQKDTLAVWLTEWMAAFIGDVANAAANTAAEIHSRRISARRNS